MVLVSDPMCSWCWGMGQEFAKFATRHETRFNFGLLLGGINVNSTQEVSARGRAHLIKLWSTVAETTGQPFNAPPDAYVHNSRQACLGLEWVRQTHQELAALEALHHFQQAFFVHGRDLSDARVIVSLLEKWDDGSLCPGVFDDMKLNQRIDFQFANARRFGSGGLPAILIGEAENEPGAGSDAQGPGALRLLAGGYIDCTMLEILTLERAQ